ncbi:hypothetical protein [Thermomonas sp.]|uniref:hypothetical protein n=1 Tax=Thermomonas sp. TaxID=1971895 RepID=UPI0026213D24|nr:hypothetical protein [Thermomonas sp.]
MRAALGGQLDLGGQVGIAVGARPEVGKTACGGLHREKPDQRRFGHVDLPARHVGAATSLRQARLRALALRHGVVAEGAEIGAGSRDLLRKLPGVGPDDGIDDNVSHLRSLLGLRSARTKPSKSLLPKAWAVATARSACCRCSRKMASS